MNHHLPAIAHITKDDLNRWRTPHDLHDHVIGVAQLAEGFTSGFGGGEIARLAGLWHDLGKYQPRWQEYLRKSSGFELDLLPSTDPGHPNHSTAGAVLACERFGPAGRTLAYVIAGHHAGLYDWHAAEAGEGKGLAYRLQQPDSMEELAASLAGNMPEALLAPDSQRLDLSTIPGGKAGFSFWLRMVFSCLVDADFLDTERYMNADKTNARAGWPAIADLKERFDGYVDALVKEAKQSPVNSLRAEILAQCRSKAAQEENYFTLTVPTGGGKTLSSMAFGLDHALAHGKQRIIYVIPYTSIIEQTAQVYRTAFGDLAYAVVEHHSSADEDGKNELSQSKLATENWDAPIIVTTNVQFFESLFAAKTSRCRKLHNIANSVVVIDEAQMMHPNFWQPMLSALELLRTHYGTTLVMSTATQPSFTSKGVKDYTDPKKWRNGLDNGIELMDDPEGLYKQLKRVEVKLPINFDERKSWEEIALEIVHHPSVLAIVNTRKDARELHALMPKETIHLSALMCGQHRSQVIEEIKRRLKADLPTRVVSTQLVEAGVDFDFPVVYRAMAGLDSIAQAAGRCNREGTATMGTTHVFIPPKPSPMGMLRKGEDACRSVLHGYEGDPLDIALFKTYFDHLYYNNDLDAKQICHDLRMDGKNLEELAVNFRTAADNFKLIEEGDYVPVIVQYKRDAVDNTVEVGLSILRKGKPERWVMRSLQRYIVNVRRRDASRLASNGSLQEVLPGLFAQVGDGLYHETFGLQTDEVILSPKQSVI